ncbi:MAG: ATP-binding protein [Candidatus Shapirobacteria bacterium]|jgi:signal transduction histidine kinase
MFYQLTYFFGFLATVSLAYFVYVNNNRRETNFIFSAFLVFVSGWIATLYLFYNSQSPFWVLVFGRFNIAFAIPFAHLIYYFAHIFPTKTKPLNHYLHLVLITETLTLFFLTILTPLVDEMEIIKGTSRTTIYGPLYPIFIVHFISYILAATVVFFKKLHFYTGIKKIQIQYIFCGLTTSVGFGITTNIIIPLLTHHTDIQNLGTIAPIIFASFASYAIIRHRFLDITLAIRNTLTYLFSSLAVSIITLVITILSGLRKLTSLDFNYLTSILVGSILVSILLPILLKNITSFLDRTIFGRTLSYQLSLKTLAEKLPQILELSDLVELIIKTLINTMGLTRAAVLITDLDKESNHYKITKTIGFNETNGISMVKDNFLTQFLEKNPRILVIDELQKITEESPDPHEQQKIQELIDHMIHIEAGLIIPVVIDKKLSSLIVLGNKKGGDVYTSEDLELLEVIASQAAVAIQNARLYKKINNYNQELQHDIDQATIKLQKQNRQLHKANDELKVLDKMKDQLIAVTSHELRTPATIIQNYLWMVLNQPDSKTRLTPKEKERIERSFTSVQDLIQLINETLDASKIDGGRLEVFLEPIKVATVFDKIRSTYTDRAAEKNLKLVMPSINPKYFIKGDETRLQEVITNLIVNSIKYTDAGTITVKVNPYPKNTKNLLFSIADTGRGIAKENIPKLFGKFYREDTSLSSSTPKTGGTGLGLYITKNLVELMQGKIWVESIHGVGSTFFFTLPQATPSQTASLSSRIIR